MLIATLDLSQVIGGAAGLVLAAFVTGWFSYRAATAKTRSDAAMAHRASSDTTATASAFDTTVKALARAAGEATVKADAAEAKADRALANEHDCVNQFAAHRAATTAEIATLRGVIDDLAGRVATGAAPAEPGRPGPRRPGQGQHGDPGLNPAT